MELQNIKAIQMSEAGPKEKYSKIKIPKEIQKEMLEFFIHTSIPRKKSKDNHLPKKEADR